MGRPLDAIGPAGDGARLGAQRDGDGCSRRFGHGPLRGPGEKSGRKARPGGKAEEFQQESLT